MPYFGKQRFSPMLFHLFFVAAPGQNQDKCSHLIWSLDRLRIREDEDLLQKFGLVRSKHLCTLVPTALKRFPNHREKHRRIPSEGRFGAFGLLGEHAGHSIVRPVSYRTTARAKAPPSSLSTLHGHVQHLLTGAALRSHAWITRYPKSSRKVYVLLTVMHPAWTVIHPRVSIRTSLQTWHVLGLQ